MEEEIRRTIDIEIVQVGIDRGGCCHCLGIVPYEGNVRRGEYRGWVRYYSARAYVADV